jgi:hypothetical protein
LLGGEASGCMGCGGLSPILGICFAEHLDHRWAWSGGRRLALLGGPGAVVAVAGGAVAVGGKQLGSHGRKRERREDEWLRRGATLPIADHTPCVKGPLAPPSVDGPDAAGEEVGAGDEVAGFEGLFDGGLIGLGGGFHGEPLIREGGWVGDGNG